MACGSLKSTSMILERHHYVRRLVATQDARNHHAGMPARRALCAPASAYRTSYYAPRQNII